MNEPGVGAGVVTLLFLVFESGTAINGAVSGADYLAAGRHAGTRFRYRRYGGRFQSCKLSDMADGSS